VLYVTCLAIDSSASESSKALRLCRLLLAWILHCSIVCAGVANSVGLLASNAAGGWAVCHARSLAVLLLARCALARSLTAQVMRRLRANATLELDDARAVRRMSLAGTLRGRDTARWHAAMAWGFAQWRLRTYAIAAGSKSLVRSLDRTATGSTPLEDAAVWLRTVEVRAVGVGPYIWRPTLNLTAI
jgi:hypothetical protein